MSCVFSESAGVSQIPYPTFKVPSFFGRILMCSRCVIHHQHELHSGKSPSFIASFHAFLRPLLVESSRALESAESSERLPYDSTKKNGCTRKEMYFLCICTTLVILMLISNALTLDYIAALIRSVTNLCIAQSLCACNTI